MLRLVRLGLLSVSLGACQTAPIDDAGDVGSDGGSSTDAGLDAGFDAGAPDAGPGDAGTDAGSTDAVAILTECPEDPAFGDGLTGLPCDYEGSCAVLPAFGGGPEVRTVCEGSILVVTQHADLCRAAGAEEPVEAWTSSDCATIAEDGASGDSCEGPFSCAEALSDGCVEHALCDGGWLLRQQTCWEDWVTPVDAAPSFEACPPDSIPAPSDLRPTNGDACTGDWVCSVRGVAVRAPYANVLLACLDGVVRLSSIERSEGCSR